MNTKEKIAVMQAFDEGRAIEHCRVVIGPQPWFDCYEPTWDWQTFEYRVKLQPNTVTFGWFVMPRTRGLTEIKMLVTSGENGVATYFGSGPIKTETIEVSE